MSRKKKPMIIELSEEQANAIMLMMESDLESIFNYGGGIDPVADWETIHYHAYQLLAYQAFKQRYKDTYDA